MAYETMAGPTVCVSGIFPSKHHWENIRFSHISCGVNSLCPGTSVSQIQPVTTQIIFQNYICAKQVRMFFLSLLVQNSSIAINISVAFYFINNLEIFYKICVCYSPDDSIGHKVLELLWGWVSGGGNLRTRTPSIMRDYCIHKLHHLP